MAQIVDRVGIDLCSSSPQEIEKMLRNQDWSWQRIMSTPATPIISKGKVVQAIVIPFDRITGQGEVIITYDPGGWVSFTFIDYATEGKGEAVVRRKSITHEDWDHLSNFMNSFRTMTEGAK